MRRPTESRAWSVPIAVFALLSLVSCGPRETAPEALRRADGGARYLDGTYAAAFTHTDPEGWRAYLQLSVRAGLIIAVCFDAVDRDGARLLTDERYLETHRLATGVYLPDLVGDLSAQLLRRQELPLATDAAAAGWSAAFHLLAGATLEAATSGASLSSAGVRPVAGGGPRLLRDDPDRLGWRAELLLVFAGGDVVAADYREVRVDGTGAVTVKSADAAYARQYEQARGLTPAGVRQELLDQLLSGSPGPIDGVAGATLTTRRLAALLDLAHAAHGRPALPNRLCR